MLNITGAARVSSDVGQRRATRSPFIGVPVRSNRRSREWLRPKAETLNPVDLQNFYSCHHRPKNRRNPEHFA